MTFIFLISQQVVDIWMPPDLGSSHGDPKVSRLVVRMSTTQRTSVRLNCTEVEVGQVGKPLFYAKATPAYLDRLDFDDYAFSRAMSP